MNNLPLKQLATVVVGVILAGYILNSFRGQVQFFQDASNGFDTGLV